MRRVLLILLGLAIAVPAISMGGTSRAPEITDPAGDAVVTQALVGTAPQTAPWADLSSVWFSSVSTVRAKKKTITGFTVTVKTLRAPAANEGVSLTAYWTAGDSCFGSVTVWRLSAGTAPPNEVYFGCNGSDPSSIASDNFTAPVKVATKGGAYVVTVPLSLFNQGLSRGIYKKGTSLHDTYATASIVPGPAATDAIRVDSAPDETVGGTLIPGFSEFGRAFVIGS